MNETALKERLKTIALEKGSTLNKIWKQLLLERFLARLSRTSYCNKFIFKGGLLLSQYIAINRETIDIDFLMTNIAGEARKIERVIQEIARIDCDDGFLFAFFSIEELSQPHMEYSGFRVTLDVCFGNMQDKIHVDIGIGDVVEPIEAIFTPFGYKGKPIFIGEITLHVYPPETIFAEKLETIISKGVINSRMKDYHDLIMMIREPDFLNIEQTSAAIQVTFNQRATHKKFPIKFDDAGMRSLQILWSSHLRGLGLFRDQLNLAEDMREVIEEINNWISSNISFGS